MHKAMLLKAIAPEKDRIIEALIPFIALRIYSSEFFVHIKICRTISFKYKNYIKNLLPKISIIRNTKK